MRKARPGPAWRQWRAHQGDCRDVPAAHVELVSRAGGDCKFRLRIWRTSRQRKVPEAWRTSQHDTNGTSDADASINTRGTGDDFGTSCTDSPKDSAGTDWTHQGCHVASSCRRQRSLLSHRGCHPHRGGSRRCRSGSPFSWCNGSWPGSLVSVSRPSGKGYRRWRGAGLSRLSPGCRAPRFSGCRLARIGGLSLGKVRRGCRGWWAVHGWAAFSSAVPVASISDWYRA